MQNGGEVEGGAGDDEGKFNGPDEWEDYVGEVQMNSAIEVGAALYTASAEGCAVACRASQLLVLMAALEELGGGGGGDSSDDSGGDFGFMMGGGGEDGENDDDDIVAELAGESGKGGDEFEQVD